MTPQALLANYRELVKTLDKATLIFENAVRLAVNDHDQLIVLREIAIGLGTTRDDVRRAIERLTTK